MRCLAAIALALALLAGSARAELAALPVRAALAADGALVIGWPPPPEQRLACAFRQRGRLLGCAGAGKGAVSHGPGSVDAALRVVPGELLRVVVYDADGAPIAAGWARLGSVVYLPAVRR